MNLRDGLHPTDVPIRRELCLRPHQLHRPRRPKGQREEDLNRPHDHFCPLKEQEQLQVHPVCHAMSLIFNRLGVVGAASLAAGVTK